MIKKNRFVRFTLIGWLGVLVQLALLALLTKSAHLPTLAATPIAVELTVLHNFFWHERVTWHDRLTSQSRALRLWRFHAGNGLVSLVGNTALTYWLVQRMHARQLPSALIAITLCALANFALADRWVFDGS